MPSDQYPIALSAMQWHHAQRDNDLTCYFTEMQLHPEIMNHLLVNGERELARFNLHSEEPNEVKFKGQAFAARRRCFQFDGVVELTRRGNAPITARANIVRCNNGALFSATFRILRSEAPGYEIGHSQWPKWVPLTHVTPSRIHADFIVEQLIGAGKNEGAIVISGTTGGGKSDLAKDIALSSIRRVIPDKSKKKRFPHLVTFEDPIEGWPLAINGNLNNHSLNLLEPDKCRKYGFSLTARQKGMDVKSLAEALLDARRQTPKCFYVGELRSPREWKEVMEFAATGHLIVVTTHAASVQETLSKILSGCGAKTPAARRQWAGFVRGIVHLEMEPVKMCGNVMLPSMWRGISAARSALVSTGLSSVIPNQQYMDSRSSYFDKLFSAEDLWSNFPFHQRRLKKLRNVIREKALELDTRDLLK